MNEVTVNRDAGMIAYEINIIKDQANKFLLQSSIEIGRRLKEAKDMVGHGNWSKWLKDEVDYSQRTASNLIKIHEEFGTISLDNQIGKQIANLGYTQAVAMLKLDVDAREDFMLVHDVDDMSTRELEDKIKEKKEIQESKETLLKRIADLEGNNTELENQLKTKAAEIKTKEGEIKTHLKSIKGLEKSAKDLEDKILASMEEEPDSGLLKEKDNELKKLKDDIKFKKQEIIRLESELSAKPKEVETQQIMYETPKEVLEELEELRNKVSTSEHAIKFKSSFDILMNQFNHLIGIVDDIKTSEPGEYDKYKGAVNKLLVKLAIE